MIDQSDTSNDKVSLSEENREMLLKIKRIKKEKRKFQAKIFQTIIFVFIGILIAMLSQLKLILQRKASLPYVYKNRVRLLLYSFGYSCCFLVSLIFNKLRFRPFKYIYVVIPALFSFQTYIYAYGYNFNYYDFPLLENIWTLIIISVYFIFSKLPNMKEKPHLFNVIGILLGLIGAFFELIFSYNESFSRKFHDNMFYIFSSNDISNNLLVLVNSLIYCSYIFSVEKFIEKNEMFTFLVYFGGVAMLITFFMSIFSGEFQKVSEGAHYLYEFNWVILYLLVYISNTIILILSPFYILKCSPLALSISHSTEFFWKFIMGFFLIMNRNNDGFFITGHYISTIFSFLGLSIIVYTKVEEEEDLKKALVEGESGSVKGINNASITNEGLLE